MLDFIMEFFNKVVDKENDPVCSCSLYKDAGCSHVDGYLCNVKTCSMLNDYKEGNKDAEIH